MNFTLPIRHPSGRRWPRPEPQTQDKAQFDPAQYVDGLTEPTRALKPVQSLHNVNSRKLANPLKSSQSKNRLRHAPSRSQLASVNNDRVVKPNKVKTVVKLGSEADFLVSSEFGEEVNEEIWDLVKDHIRQEAATAEMDRDLGRLNLRARQALRRTRSLGVQPDQKESIEETVKKLTAADIPVNVHLLPSLQAVDHRPLLNATPIRILANELPDLDAFSTELQAAHGDKPGVSLLRSMPPKHWVFQSRLGAKQFGNHLTIGGSEYNNGGGPEAARRM